MGSVQAGGRIPGNVENGGLQGLGNHVVPVQDLGGEDGQDGVHLLVKDKPEVFELKELAHQQILCFFLGGIGQRAPYSGHILKVLRDAEIRDLVIALHAVPLVAVTLHHSYVILLGDLDLDPDAVLCLRVVIIGEVDSDDAGDLGLVLLVLAQEVLDVLVLRQGELREGQDRRVELQSVELVEDRRGLLFFLRFLRFLGGGDWLCQLLLLGLGCRGGCGFCFRRVLGPLLRVG